MRTIILLISFFLCVSCTNDRPVGVANEPNFLEGVWKDKLDSNDWVFGENKMSYGGYSHFYTAKKDTLLISGIPYEIKFSNKDSMVLYSTRLKSSIYLVKE